MVAKTGTKRAMKRPFKQSEYDRLVTRKAKAILGLRKVRQELASYEKTHTSGIRRLAKGETWI